MPSTITPQQLAELQASGQPLVLLDVRTPLEFRQVHIDFARNVPLGQLTAEQIPPGPVYVICHSGARGRKGAERLTSAGLNAINVDGGITAWQSAGLPVTRQAIKVISLERQVRIAAGLLVLTGVLLGWLAHPGFYALSAFVGAGLLFAGITNTCGMGLLLARMPWNHSPPPTDPLQPARQPPHQSCATHSEPDSRVS